MTDERQDRAGEQGARRSGARAAVSKVADGGAWRIELAGELDLASVEPVRGRVTEVLSNRPDRLVFDLAGLSFMDSTGIALLLETAEQTTVEVHDPPPIIRTVLKAMGIDGVLRVTP